MSKMIIVEGNSNDKDNVRAFMVKGERGYGIASIEKTTTSGLVDTYTITYDDGSTSTFNVTNGATPDMSNYYNKTETYNKTEVNNLVSGDLKREVVETLPTTDINPNIIYMVPKTGSSGDVYNEYLYINSNWELIGSTTVDLSNYYTKSEVNALITGALEASY